MPKILKSGFLFLLLSFLLGCSTTREMHQQNSAVVISSLKQIEALIIKHYFMNQDFDTTWKAKFITAAEKINQTKGLNKQYQVIVDLIEEFNHSHLAYIPPQYSKKNYSQSLTSKKHTDPSINGFSLDFKLVEMDSKVYISEMDPNGPSYQRGLRNGSELLAVDDIEVDASLLKKGYAYMILQTKANSGALTLKIAEVDSKQIKKIALALPPVHKEQNRMGLAKITEMVHIEKREDRILYLAFNAFTFEQVGKIKQAIQSNRDAVGMIIDLRNNPGGMGMLACGIALEFCEKDYSLGTMSGPELNLNFPVLAQSDCYQGPLILLVNGFSFSTSEILARGMQVAKEALVVGTQTRGMALPSVFMKLSDGSIFQYPVADFKDSTGRLLEAQGVTPDFLVKYSLDDIKNGHDPQFNKAVELILQHL